MAFLDPSRAQIETLAGLFRARLENDPAATAYHHFDVSGGVWQTTSWEQMAAEIGRWQAALQKEGLFAGDRVAVMMRNCREWVVFDQAALGLGLVTVPLYTDDRPDNLAYVLRDSGARFLLIEGQSQWAKLRIVATELGAVNRIVSVQAIPEDQQADDQRLKSLNEWLFGINGALQAKERSADSLASIVYTSGTTGRPKGVMLSHRNMLSNAWAASQCAGINADDLLLSFLPLSHMLERTVGYYLPMLTGAQIAYARGISFLAEDLRTIKPTILISVPRIFERMHGKIASSLEQASAWRRRWFDLGVEIGYRRFEYQQGRRAWSPQFWLWPLLERTVAARVQAQVGGRMRFAVVGGAPLSEEIAKLFIGLGLPLLHGYGLTESSPVISVNRLQDNQPASIGLPLPGVAVRIGDNDELQVQGPAVMQGYWNNETASAEVFTNDGWLRTGDKARIDADNRLYITGRIKDIIVLANGEKVPPADMEMAIGLDPLFEQVLIIGEGRPFLTALLVLNQQEWSALAATHGISAAPESLGDETVSKVLQKRVDSQLKEFPGYAQVRRLHADLEPWTVEAGLLTPTLKQKRPAIMTKYADVIETLYR